MIFRRYMLASACLASAILVTTAAQAVPVELSGTPPPVQKTINTQIGDGKLEDIDKTNENAETTFDVSFTDKAGDDQGFTVADDGTLLSVDVELARTPVPVQKSIRSLATGWELEDINKNVADAEISYEVDVTKGDREKSFTVGADGALLDAEVGLDETPPAVQAAITKHVGNGNLQSIDEDVDPDGDSFDINVLTSTGESKSFSLGTNGNLLSVEVTLEKVPPGARKAIQEKIGDGKILSIDKSLVEKKDGVLPYQVEGRKNGKPFDFSVGPRGRFLGMDD